MRGRGPGAVEGRGPLTRKESNLAHPGLETTARLEPTGWALPGAAFVPGVNEVGWRWVVNVQTNWIY